MESRVLQYHIMGEGDPVVLVPGGLTGWLSWIPHQDRLSQHHQVIRVQPIHNELGSAGQPGDPGYSAKVERESLRLTLDELGIEQADFAGWSAGGRALMEFTVFNPERVRSLTLIEPPAYWLLDELDGSDANLDAADDLLARLAGAEVTEDDLAQFLGYAGLASDPSHVRDHPSWLVWVPHRMTLSWLGFIDPEPTSMEISAIVCPVLLVKGDASTEFDRRAVDLLGERLAYARIVELSGDHASHIQSIDRFIEEVEAHLHRTFPLPT